MELRCRALIWYTKKYDWQIWVFAKNSPAYWAQRDVFNTEKGGLRKR
jgi:hypothetical protein